VQELRPRHGFNSSAEVWTPVLEALRASDPRWADWAGAASVPGFQPVAERAEQLRRNLTAFLAGRAPVSGEPFLKLNVVAHSMGGLDSRYLVGAPRYNERCGDLACTSAEGTPEPCCPADANGHPVPWRDRVVSITTLSTPHCGSSFADAGVRWLQNGLVDFAFRKVTARYFGLDAAGQDSMRRTFFALSQQYCRETMGPSFPAPSPGRSYDWACATGEESCSAPPIAPEDGPVAVAGGRAQLPRPSATPTIFSWASLSCVTGTCGDILDPGLLLPHLTVRSAEGDNDGVVSARSARFGIFMGIRSNDHFHWNRLTYSSGTGFLSKLFGVAHEPVDRWYSFWLAELARAGY
jgi:pimeloyl-ACP methyl ester carboxylesterase